LLKTSIEFDIKLTVMRKHISLIIPFKDSINKDMNN
jgi:hypothetical protein